jgi:preprotein translocase subunit YajC
MTLVELLPFAAIAAAFWFLIIRPASVRRKAQAQLIASLVPGQRIMTTAGVFGTLVSIGAQRVSVEVAPGVVVEMLDAAIAQVVPASDHVPEGAEGDLAALVPATDPPSDVDEAPRPLTPEADRG